MFESALYNKLRSDTALLSYLNTFGGVPAIFSEYAPEGATMPYLVFRISRSADLSPAVQKFSIFIDYYDNSSSASNSRKAAERIEFILDRVELSHERYSNIRIFFFGGSPLEETDPRIKRYNLQFMARAGRKKWIDQLNDVTTTTTSGS
jgi:hypothetical protein